MLSMLNAITGCQTYVRHVEDVEEILYAHLRRAFPFTGKRLIIGTNVIEAGLRGVELSQVTNG